HAHPVQPALERAGARPHRVGDPMDVERAAREQSADDLPHTTVEVACGGVTRWRIPTSHVVTPPGRRCPRTVMIVRLAGGAVLPSRAVHRPGGPGADVHQWRSMARRLAFRGYRCSGHDALPPDGRYLTPWTPREDARDDEGEDVPRALRRGGN